MIESEKCLCCGSLIEVSVPNSLVCNDCFRLIKKGRLANEYFY